MLINLYLSYRGILDFPAEDFELVSIKTITQVKPELIIIWKVLFMLTFLTQNLKINLPLKDQI